MVDKIGLSSGVTANLQSLQRTFQLANRTDQRLASGLRVKDPLDGAAEFFTSRALTNRASDLTQAKGNIDQAISTVEAANVGLEAIDDLAQQARAVAQAAKSTGDATERQALAAQFNELRGQIDSLAQDAGFNGTNLISSSPDNLDISLNEDGSSSLTIQGTDSSSAGLGIGSRTFASDADIDAAIADTTSAVSTVRTNASTLGSSTTVLQNRIDFTQNLTNTLESGAADLTLADLTEEAANRLALGTRQQLGANSLALAAESERAVLGILG
ncbi:MAG: flagellin [Alphaproteobacteria bacterium]|jgi:flagellin-like hook-associated protein FlgL|nr:flagellin [Alphaproteobacteria bacterium]